MENANADSLDSSRQMFLAASLLDRGDIVPALWCLDGELAAVSRDAVDRMLPVLPLAGLVTDLSLLPLPKPLLKAAIKLCILSSFAVGRQKDEKALSALYCQLAHFQDMTQVGATVLHGLDDLGGPTGAMEGTAWFARTLHRVADEFEANVREMEILLARLNRLDRLRAAGQDSTWRSRPQTAVSDYPDTVQ